MIKGREYSVSPENSIEVEDGVGMYWKSSLHNFLEIRASEPVKSNDKNEENKTEDTPEENKGEEVSTEDAVTVEVEAEEPVVVVSKKTNKKK